MSRAAIVGGGVISDVLDPPRWALPPEGTHTCCRTISEAMKDADYVQESVL